MMRNALPGAILSLALWLSACGGAKTEERDTAAGKILPGSISDAMLQTDGLQSEALLEAPKVIDEDEEPGAPGAKAEKAGGKPKKDVGGEDEAPSKQASPETPAKPAPTATPTP